MEGEIDINLLLSMKDVVKVEAVEVDPAREELIHATVEDALTALIEMREEEGKHLQEDILSRLETIEEHGKVIKSRLPSPGWFLFF